MFFNNNYTSIDCIIKYIIIVYSFDIGFKLGIYNELIPLYINNNCLKCVFKFNLLLNQRQLDNTDMMEKIHERKFCLCYLKMKSALYSAPAVAELCLLSSTPVYAIHFIIFITFDINYYIFEVHCYVISHLIMYNMCKTNESVLIDVICYSTG